MFGHNVDAWTDNLRNRRKEYYFFTAGRWHLLDIQDDASCRSAKRIMPNRRLSMPRIIQVLLCYVAGKGTRSISDLMDISRNTVKKYITIFNLSGKTIEEILAMDEPELMALFKRPRMGKTATDKESY